MATRIELTDTSEDVLVKMAEGNPGALSVCIRLMKEEAGIDPDCVFAGLGSILSLDTLGLYGSSIWMLYKDVCGGDLTKMCAVLRSHQLGLLTHPQIHHAVRNRGEGIDCDEVLASVQDELPRFGRVAEHQAVDAESV